jgi:hypothetical protein
MSQMLNHVALWSTRLIWVDSINRCFNQRAILNLRPLFLIIFKPASSELIVKIPPIKTTSKTYILNQLKLGQRGFLWIKNIR